MADEGDDEAEPGEVCEGDFLAEDFLRNHRREDDEIDAAAPESELLRLPEDASCTEFGCARPGRAALDSGTFKFLAPSAVRTG